MSELFRQKNVERAKSPEVLDDYIKVNSPSIWIALIAAFILVVAFAIWTIFGTLPTILASKLVVSDGTAVFYLSSEDVQKVRLGMVVTVDGVDWSIEEIAESPTSKEEIETLYDSYTLFQLVPSDWSFAVRFASDGLADGVYDGKIILKKEKPLSFILN